MTTQEAPRMNEAAKYALTPAELVLVPRVAAEAAGLAWTEPDVLTAEAVERELHRVMCGGAKHRSRWTAQCIAMAPNIARGLSR